MEEKLSGRSEPAWYVRNFLVYGSPTGSTNSILIAQLGGLLPKLISHFSIHTLVSDTLGLQFHGHGVAAGRSSVSSPWLRISLLLIAAWLMVAYFLAARGHSVEGPIWLPVWLTMPLLAGLFYHVLVVIALASNGTPGWYLNILAPFLAFAMGLGIERISRKKLGRAFLRGALIYAVAFLIIVMWSQVALFSGCAIKNNAKLYQFDGQLFCLDRLSEIAHRLSIIGWPNCLHSHGPGGRAFVHRVGVLHCSPLTARESANGQPRALPGRMGDDRAAAPYPTECQGAALPSSGREQVTMRRGGYSAPYPHTSREVSRMRSNLRH